MEENAKVTNQEEKSAPKLVEEEPVVTYHEMKVGRKTLKYTATTGILPIKNHETGEIEATVFFIAYRKEGEEGRPLMFSFNGGPGSSSVWLHLGAVGPKRVKMLDDGGMPAPPYELIDNPLTWLEETDLVFIDPVGTGYSRPATKELGEKFWGLKGDIESVGEFIRLFLTRYERWNSPLYLVGESYGTTRAAGLAGHLIDRGIAFNGIVLVSTILQFQTALFSRGNDLPYPLFLPTYAATAIYHGKASKPAKKSLRETLKEVEAFAMGEYWTALAQGDALSAADRKKVTQKLARYSGLSEEYVDQADLRIEIQKFCKELLRKEKRTVGRLDSRFKGMDAKHTNHHPDFDPSMSMIRPPYTAALNDYVRRSLGYKTDLPYMIMGGMFEKWDWGSAGDGHPDTGEALRAAFAKNPHMRVFVASGYYDLATPYFATEYTLWHLGLDPEVRDQVEIHEYEAGHMMYIHVGCLAKLKKDVAGFLTIAR